MEQEALAFKQKYLRENVLEKGYDPDKFMEFLTMKKGENGINLENWTYEELTEVTKEFLTNNKLDIEKNLNFEDKNEEKEEEKENEEEDEKVEENIEIKENTNIDKNLGINTDNYFNCCLVEQTPITKHDILDIEITKPKIEKEGFFSFSHSTYLVVTSTLNLQVRRKYSDFLWLYNILKTQFPNCIVPPFFKKKENLDLNKMNQKIFFIQKFLNSIAIHPILKNSKIFYDFLSIQDHKQFVKSKSAYGKLPSPLSIKKLKTLNGQIKVSFFQENEEYYNKIKSKLDNQEEIYDRLLYHYKLLLININQTNIKMKEISNIWKELYNQKNTFFESPCTEGVYDSYIKMMDEWGNLQIENSKLIINSIKKFFRFIKEEFICFKDLSLTVENYKNNYYKKYHKLLNTKENFLAKIEKEKKEQGKENNKIENDEESQFNKLMLKDIIKMNDVKRDYGCYLNIYINEYDRIRDLNDKRFKENLVTFIKDLSAQVSGFTFKLGEIRGFIDSFN